MIAYLQGNIIYKSGNSITVANEFIGYEVYLPKGKLESIQIGEQKHFFIFTKVREDDISLYGFEQRSELLFFKQLLDVNGIGPKIALEICNQNLADVQQAIIQKNTAYLSKIPGVGKKTAERIALELQGKVIPSIDSLQNSTQGISVNEQIVEESTTALVNLGYSRYEINRFLQKMEQTVSTTEELITHFLQNI